MHANAELIFSTMKIQTSEDLSNSGTSCISKQVDFKLLMK